MAIMVIYNQDKLTSKQYNFNLFKNLRQHVLYEINEGLTQIN